MPGQITRPLLYFTCTNHSSGFLNHRLVLSKRIFNASHRADDVQRPQCLQGRGMQNQLAWSAWFESLAQCARTPVHAPLCTNPCAATLPRRLKNLRCSSRDLPANCDGAIVWQWCELMALQVILRLLLQLMYLTQLHKPETDSTSLGEEEKTVQRRPQAVSDPPQDDSANHARAAVAAHQRATPRRALRIQSRLRH